MMHSTYTYRDFSTVPHDELRDSVGESVKSGYSNVDGDSSKSEAIKVQRFPVKMYSILSRKEFSHIVAWMPHGRSWKILKPDEFEQEVMPHYFNYANYHSFARLISAWSFRRVSSGPDKGSYYHEMFLRGKPYLHKHMRRLAKTEKKMPMKRADEPDFYAMSIKHPLPEIDHEIETPRAETELSYHHGNPRSQNVSLPALLAEERIKQMRGAVGLHGSELQDNRQLRPTGTIPALPNRAVLDYIENQRLLQELRESTMSLMIMQQVNPFLPPPSMNYGALPTRGLKMLSSEKLSPQNSLPLQRQGPPSTFSLQEIYGSRDAMTEHK